jgi:hypothetical protein
LGFGEEAVVDDEVHAVADGAALAAEVALWAAAVDQLLYGEQLAGFSSDE